MKKIAYILVFFTLVSCGYEPMFSKKNSYNISIKDFTLEGDKNISRKLISLLNFKKNDNQNFSSYNLIVSSSKATEVVAKDGLGNASVYKTRITVDFTLENISSVGKIFKTKTFSTDSSYNNISNKFDLSQYQNTIEENLITIISEEIIIFINS